MADALSICAEAAVGEALAWVWRNVVGIPKVRKKNGFFEAIMAGRHAEILRLANVPKATSVPGLSHLFDGERLILSMPVFLYESESSRRLYPPAGKTGRGLVWEHRASSGRLITISLVDRGTLRLTNRRFAYAGVRRHGEFPLDALTHLSTTWSSIALAARGRHGISYFTHLNDTRLSFPVIPQAGESWQALAGSFNLKGTDLKKIVDILNSPTPPVQS